MSRRLMRMIMPRRTPRKKPTTRKRQKARRTPRKKTKKFFFWWGEWLDNATNAEKFSSPAPRPGKSNYPARPRGAQRGSSARSAGAFLRLAGVSITFISTDNAEFSITNAANISTDNAEFSTTTLKSSIARPTIKKIAAADEIDNATKKTDDAKK